MSVLLALLALSLERICGYPDWLCRAIGHPVSWIGKLIEWADRAFNRESDSFASRRAIGVAVLIGLAAVASAAAWAAQWLFGAGFGFVATVVIATTLLAQRSLEIHVGAVAAALETGGIEAGRAAVSQIVGRDPESLDEAGVARAAIESLAENFSDGVVAPSFWMAVGGLPGAAIYKAVNTADSMIGHRSARHEAFGWAAARFDDLINLPASRLTALLFVAAAFLSGNDARGAWRAVRRDARKHRSPNAGWAEAAMAGALRLALAGPRSYGGELVDDAYMGDGGRREANASDIRRALQLFRYADALLIVLALIVAMLVIWRV